MCVCVCVPIGFPTFERWICATCNLLSHSHHSLPTKVALMVPHPNLPKVTCDGRGILQTLTMLPFNSPKGVLPKKVANSLTFYNTGVLLQFSDGREMFHDQRIKYKPCISHATASGLYRLHQGALLPNWCGGSAGMPRWNLRKCDRFAWNWLLSRRGLRNALFRLTFWLFL